jgi:hypothetical protein
MRRLPLLLATLLLLLLPALVESRTWYVKVDGTGDAPTIEAAIDSSQDGDEILVAAGTYTWTNQSPANDHGIMMFVNKEIWLHSEAGRDSTIIDAEGEGPLIGISGEIAPIEPTIEGFTLRNGSADYGWVGAAIWCSSCHPTIRNNVISDNWTFDWGGALFFSGSNGTICDNVITRNIAVDRGGGIYCYNCQLVIRDNIFDDNGAGHYGGAIYCQQSNMTIDGNLITRNGANSVGGGVYCLNSDPIMTHNIIGWNLASDYYGGGIFCGGSSPTIINNTLFGNDSPSGAAIYCYSSSPIVSDNIVANSLNGEAIHCDGSSSPDITCNDFWNNAAGDGNCTLGAHNFSANPVFCNEASEDFSLRENSPCAAPNSPGDCGLVGALPVGCWDTPISRTALVILAAALLAVAAWAARRAGHQART